MSSQSTGSQSSPLQPEQGRLQTRETDQLNGKDLEILTPGLHQGGQITTLPQYTRFPASTALLNAILFPWNVLYPNFHVKNQTHSSRPLSKLLFHETLANSPGLKSSFVCVPITRSHFSTLAVIRVCPLAIIHKQAIHKRKKTIIYCLLSTICRNTLFFTLG